MNSLSNRSYDLSGCRNTGNLHADTHPVPGRFGHALDFDGVGDYVDYPSLDLRSLITGAWVVRVKLNTVVSNKSIMQYYIDDANRGKIFIFDSGLGVVFAFNLRIGDVWVIRHYESTLVPVAGNWYQVAAVQNGSNFKLYVNDIDQGVPGTDSGNWFGSIGNLWLARFDHSMGEQDGIDGVIDHAMIYSRELVQSGIAQPYREPFCMFPENIMPEFGISA